MHYPFSIKSNRPIMTSLRDTHGKEPYISLSQTDVAYTSIMYNCSSKYLRFYIFLFILTFVIFVGPSMVFCCYPIHKQNEKKTRFIFFTLKIVKNTPCLCLHTLLTYLIEIFVVKKMLQRLNLYTKYV